MPLAIERFTCSNGRSRCVCANSVFDLASHGAHEIAFPRDVGAADNFHDDVPRRRNRTVKKAPAVSLDAASSITW